MVELNADIQKADWKLEKHVPVIEAPAEVKAGEVFEVKVSVGKEIAHPNTTEHHIAWITLFFHAEGDKFSQQVGHFEFSAHGASVAGPNQGAVYAQPQATAALIVKKPGTLQALALCNIHGLWQSAQEVKLAG